MMNGKTWLPIFNGYTVTEGIGDGYCQQVILPCSKVTLVRPHIGPLLLKSCLEMKNFTRIDWPAYFSVLNPVEHE